MSDKPITDEEIERWKTMCEEPGIIEKEYSKSYAPWPIYTRQQMARAKIGFVAETVMPRLIAEVERLRAELAEYHHPASLIYRKPYVEEADNDD